MKPLVVANWKMNPPTITKAKELFALVKKELRNNNRVEVVICPPLPYLSVIKGHSQNIKLGAQNCFWEKTGAYTGGVSPLMLKDLGCQYVIVGHSETRINFGETDEMINKKIRTIIEVKLKPILCIGETERERKEGKTNLVITRGIEKALAGIQFEVVDLNIAYEPVWAIGTGNLCNPQMAREARLLIKEKMEKLFGFAAAKDIRILYGGSVDGENAKSFIEEAGFEGLLVGGASLNPLKFGAIVNSISLN